VGGVRAARRRRRATGSVLTTYSVRAWVSQKEEDEKKKEKKKSRVHKWRIKKEKREKKLVTVLSSYGEVF
jgi:hypothetical protein